MHLIVGILGVLVFLATGAVLLARFPEAYADNESIRYLYRANHIYILLASLINLVMGVYLAQPQGPVRRGFSVMGSTFMIFALVMLILAFFVEAPKATPHRLLTTMGVALIFAGAIAQIPAFTRKPQ